MSVVTELRTVLARLELCSQVGAVNMSPETQTGEGNDRGGRRPPGGIDRRDDRDIENVLKSADHFKVRMRHCRTESDYRRVLLAAESALTAHLVADRSRGPEPHPPVFMEPHKNDPGWKLWVSQCGLGATEIARRHSVSRQHVYDIWAEYGRRDAA